MWDNVVALPPNALIRVVTSGSTQEGKLISADEIHVHGYDLKKDVTAGGSVEFDFTATIEGRFEVELENAGTQIAMLEVDPS